MVFSCCVEIPLLLHKKNKQILHLKIKCTWIYFYVNYSIFVFASDIINKLFLLFYHMNCLKGEKNIVMDLIQSPLKSAEMLFDLNGT